MDQRRIERRTASTLLNLEQNQMLKRNYTTKPQALESLFVAKRFLNFYLYISESFSTYHVPAQFFELIVNQSKHITSRFLSFLSKSYSLRLDTSSQGTAEDGLVGGNWLPRF